MHDQDWQRRDKLFRKAGHARTQSDHEAAGWRLHLERALLPAGK